MVGGRVTRLASYLVMGSFAYSMCVDAETATEASGSGGWNTPQAVAMQRRFASMCVGGHEGRNPRENALHAVALQSPSSFNRGHEPILELANLCLVSACMLRTQHAVFTPATYLVDDTLPEAVKRFMRYTLGVDTVTIPSPGAHASWPKSKRFPRAPKRAYTFNKLHAWKLLSSDETILFFDADLFWTRDPVALFERYTPFAALTSFPGQMAHKPGEYVNSGLMLFTPNERDYAALIGNWTQGTFNLVRPLTQRDKVSDQDVVRTVFKGRVNSMGECDQFRGFVDAQGSFYDRDRHGGMVEAPSKCASTFGLHHSRFLPWAEQYVRNKTDGPCRGNTLDDVLAASQSELNARYSK